jgi:choline monooxygenase
VRFSIDPDISRAETLPGAAYCDPALFEEIRDKVLRRAWFVTPEPPAAPGRVVPFCNAGEPLLLVRDGETLRCLSNVCTHRGNLLVEAEGEHATLRCRYHGRRFALDGRMTHAPEFEGARDFPSARDHLPSLPLGRLGPLTLSAIDPAFPLEELPGPLRALPIGVFDPSSTREYAVAANWMLYVENYLEGLHIPFVHPALSEALDYGAYRTELLPRGVLQIGVARAGEEAFPDGVAAYYYWLFPNLMLNFYPWGLSLNLVEPVAVDRTRVHFRSYVVDESLRARGAGAALDAVELEDEAVVHAVQAGVRARLYRRGRYSPSRETGVHHFHRLLGAALG